MAERKKFIDVKVPILHSDVNVLGTPKELEGRTIKLDLSRKLRGKGVMMTLQMFPIDEKKIVAIPKKIELVRSYLARVIRKRTDNIEDSIKMKCSDIELTVKPFLITRKRVSRVVRKNLRNNARDFLVNYAKERTYLELCDEVLSGTLQRNMLPRLKKIYPLAFCEIRVIETKKLSEIDIKEMELSPEVLEEEDNPKKEEEVEQKLEQESIDEVVEDAEEGEESSEDQSDELEVEEDENKEGEDKKDKMEESEDKEGEEEEKKSTKKKEKEDAIKE